MDQLAVLTAGCLLVHDVERVHVDRVRKLQFDLPAADARGGFYRAEDAYGPPSAQFGTECAAEHGPPLHRRVLDALQADAPADDGAPRRMAATLLREVRHRRGDGPPEPDTEVVLPMGAHPSRARAPDEPRPEEPCRVIHPAAARRDTRYLRSMVGDVLEVAD